MNDREREEIKTFARDIFNKSSPVSQYGADQLAGRLYEVGYRHAPDRMAGRFTEEGFRAWLTKHPGAYKLSAGSIQLAAEYAATLETEPMRAEEIDKSYARFRQTGMGSMDFREVVQPLTVHQPDPVESPECPNCKAHLDLKVRCEKCGVSFDCHAPMLVEGGLTRGWLSDRFESHPGEGLDAYFDAIFSRIQSDRAALVQEINSMAIRLISEQESCAGAYSKLEKAHAELDTLKANSIAVPKEWPDRSRVIRAFFYGTDHDHSMSLAFEIPRPIPETREMAPVDMAEVWMKAFRKNGFSKEDAKERLMNELLSGKTIQQLMSEANLPTTTEVKV